MRLGLYLSVLLAAFVAVPAAATPAWEFDFPYERQTNASWNFATSFSVVDPIQVTALGYYQDDFTRNLESSPVALYRCDTAGCLTTGTLLAAAGIDRNDDLVGHFLYENVAPQILAPGDYLIASVSKSNFYSWNNPGFASDPSIVIKDSRVFEEPFLNQALFNTQLDGSARNGFFGGNFLLIPAPVPEPAAWGMMIAGVALAGGALRRRRSVAPRQAFRLAPAQAGSSR